MNTRLLGFVALGLAAVALGVGGILWMTRGAHIELKGSIQKVRLQEMDEKSAVAVLDFRFVNPADYPFVVRNVSVVLIDKDGREVEGMPVSEVDARRLFQYYPLLGQKYNDSLLARERVAPKHSMDKMTAARFELPKWRLERRKAFRVSVEDVDGAVSEMVEQEAAKDGSKN